MFIAEVNPYTLMSIASMFIALMAFLASILFNRRTETKDLLNLSEDRNTNLQHLVEKLEDDLKFCRARVLELVEENTVLLRKIAGIDTKTLENPKM